MRTYKLGKGRNDHDKRLAGRLLALNSGLLGRLAVDCRMD